MSKRLFTSFFALSFAVFTFTSSYGAWSASKNSSSIKVGSPCSTKGLTSKIGSSKVVCDILKNKLIWKISSQTPSVSSQLANPTPSPKSSQDATKDLIRKTASSLYAVRCGDNPNSSTLTTGVGADINFTSDIKAQGYVGAILFSGLSKADCEKEGSLHILQNYKSLEGKWISSDSNGLGLLAVKSPVNFIHVASSIPAISSLVYDFTTNDRGASAASGTFQGVIGDSAASDVGMSFKFTNSETLEKDAIFNSEGLLISLGGHPLGWFCGNVLSCTSGSEFLNFLPNARKLQVVPVVPKIIPPTAPRILEVYVNDSILDVVFKPSVNSDNSYANRYYIGISSNGRTLSRYFGFPGDASDNGDGTFTYSYQLNLDTFQQDFGYSGTAPNFTLNMSSFGNSGSTSPRSNSWSLGLSAYDQFNS